MAGCLVLLLAAVGTLQYRWIGDVSRAERQRLRESVDQRGAELADGIDLELTRLYSAFRLERAQTDDARAAALMAAFARATRDSAFGAAIRDVYLVDSADTRGPLRLNRANGTVEPTAWPPELQALATRLAHEPALQSVSGLPVPPGFIVIEPEVPALVVPLPSVQPPIPTAPGEMLVRTVAARDGVRAVVVQFDPAQVRDGVVRPRVERTFGTSATSEFDVAVVRADGTLVYGTTATPMDARRVDLSRSLFGIKLDAVEWTRTTAPVPGDAGRAPANVSITIVRRGTPGAAPDAHAPLGGTPGWTLLVRAKRGSVDAVVARSRLRNLIVSGSVLGVLAAGLVLLGVTALREQRRSEQHLSFVASVSHELKTPLAVIRSAADNLADGVVASDQVGRYAALIRDEGRRLSAMVDRVMDFAGARAGSLVSAHVPVALGALVRDVVEAASLDASGREVTVVVDAPTGDGPTVLGDASALRSALLNGVGNAVKYSAPGTQVVVALSSAGGRVRVVVSDRGLGIDADERAQLFEPFVRGRRALASQVRGSGVGLAIVRDVMVAHRGTASIEPREGGGTVLTLDLPSQEPQA